MIMYICINKIWWKYVCEYIYNLFLESINFGWKFFVGLVMLF